MDSQSYNKYSNNIHNNNSRLMQDDQPTSIKQELPDSLEQLTDEETAMRLFLASVTDSSAAAAAAMFYGTPTNRSRSSSTYSRSTRTTNNVSTQQLETCVCEVCQVELGRYDALFHHKLLHFNTGRVCYVCDLYFTGPIDELRLHVATQHRDITGLHPKVQASDTAFVCPVCVQRFSTSKALIRHQTQIHCYTAFSPNNFTCTVCAVDCQTQNELIGHLQGHQHKDMKVKLQSIFICIDCRSIFSSRDSYAFHMMTRAQNEACDVITASKQLAETNNTKHLPQAIDQELEQDQLIDEYKQLREEVTMSEGLPDRVRASASDSSVESSVCHSRLSAGIPAVEQTLRDIAGSCDTVGNIHSKKKAEVSPANCQDTNLSPLNLTYVAPERHRHTNMRSMGISTGMFAEISSSLHRKPLKRSLSVTTESVNGRQQTEKQRRMCWSVENVSNNNTYQTTNTSSTHTVRPTTTTIRPITTTTTTTTVDVGGSQESSLKPQQKHCLTPTVTHRSSNNSTVDDYTSSHAITRHNSRPAAGVSSRSIGHDTSYRSMGQRSVNSRRSSSQHGMTDERNCWSGNKTDEISTTGNNSSLEHLLLLLRRTNEHHFEQQQQQQQQLFVCRYCDIIYTDRMLYTLHMGLHNVNNPWQCNLCGTICNGRQQFAVHVLHY